MKISRESLEREAAATGFRAEILEKVIHLFSLLDGLADSFLLPRKALKTCTPNSACGKPLSRTYTLGALTWRLPRFSNHSAN